MLKVQSGGSNSKTRNERVGRGRTYASLLLKLCNVQLISSDSGKVLKGGLNLRDALDLQGGNAIPGSTSANLLMGHSRRKLFSLVVPEG